MSYIPTDALPKDLPKELRSTGNSKLDIKVNVKYELDKEAYRRFVADMKQIEAEFKNKPKKVSYKDLYKQVESDMDEMGIPEKQDDTTEHIPATFKDVCEWWIKTYPAFDIYKKIGGKHRMFDNRYDKIRNHMEKLLKETND